VSPVASSPGGVDEVCAEHPPPSRKNTLWPCHSSDADSTSKPSVMVYQGISQPSAPSVARCPPAARVRRRRGWCHERSDGPSGPPDRRQGQPRQACSGQPNTPGSKKARLEDQLRAALEQIEQAYLALGSVRTRTFCPQPAKACARRSAASGVTGAGQGLLLNQEPAGAQASHSCWDTIAGVFNLAVALLFLLSFLKTDRTDSAVKNFHELAMHTARIPPVDPAPATITAVLAMSYWGHICPSFEPVSFLSL